MTFHLYHQIDTKKEVYFRFSIPELPLGEQLVFNLRTTWGDRHYVGLNGIEIFSSEGHPVPIKKVTNNWICFQLTINIF